MKKQLPFISVLFLLITVQSFAQHHINRSYGLWSIDISPDDKYIAIGGDDSLLKIFTDAGVLYRTVQTRSRGMIRHLAWHPKENLLSISTRHSTWFINPETNQETQLEGMPDGARATGWNYNGELFAASAGSGQIWIWNKQGKLLRKIQKLSGGKKDTNDILGLDWHPSRNILVTVGDEIRIYDTSGHQLNMFIHRKQQTGILTVKWHPSGEFFVTGDYGQPNEGINTLLQFWKADGTLIKEWPESKDEIRNVRWNKQGSMLATGSDALRIWSAKGELLYTGQPNGSTLWSVDWTSDSDKIISVSFDKANMRVWNNKAELLATYQY